MTKSSGEDTVRLYLDRKRNKVNNYGYSAWESLPKHFDGQVVEDQLRKVDTEKGFDKVLSLPEVEWTLSQIDKNLLKETNIKVLD